MDDLKDLIIIGGSAAGVSAAIYAARRKLNFLIISGDIGGEVLLSGEIENYPGILSTNGVDMTERYKTQLDHYAVEQHLDTWVTNIQKENKIITITAKKGEETKTYKAKTVIITTGVKPRHLNVPGEKEFYQKGVTYCTVCDGPLFKNKITATIGTGNSALESALMMAEISQKHYVLLKYDDFKGETIMADKLKAKENVEILPQAITKEITGETLVNGLTYTDKNQQEHHIEVQGVFVHIGMTPQSQFAQHLDHLPSGEFIVDQLCQTSIPGIFAAGDVTNIPFQQIVIASGQGATAALSAIEYINKWE